MDSNTIEKIMNEMAEHYEAYLADAKKYEEEAEEAKRKAIKAQNRAAKIKDSYNALNGIWYIGENLK